VPINIYVAPAFGLFAPRLSFAPSGSIAAQQRGTFAAGTTAFGTSPARAPVISPSALKTQSGSMSMTPFAGAHPPDTGRKLAVANTLLGVMILALLPLRVPAQRGLNSAGSEKLAREASTILAKQCVSCHGPEQKKGGLDLSRRATALKGARAGSRLCRVLPTRAL